MLKIYKIEFLIMLKIYKIEFLIMLKIYKIEFLIMLKIYKIEFLIMLKIYKIEFLVMLKIYKIEFLIMLIKSLCPSFFPSFSYLFSLETPNMRVLWYQRETIKLKSVALKRSYVYVLYNLS